MSSKVSLPSLVYLDRGFGWKPSPILFCLDHCHSNWFRHCRNGGNETLSSCVILLASGLILYTLM